MVWLLSASILWVYFHGSDGIRTEINFITQCIYMVIISTLEAMLNIFVFPIKYY